MLRSVKLLEEPEASTAAVRGNFAASVCGRASMGTCLMDLQREGRRAAGTEREVVACCKPTPDNRCLRSVPG